MDQIVSKFGNFIRVDEAVNKVINAPGNLLTIGYGYITPSHTVNAVFKSIFKWLAKDSGNFLEIFVGVIWNSKTPEAEHESEKKVKENFLNLLPSELYDAGFSDRIIVYAVNQFHPKFMLKSHETTEENIPSMGILGSSNLSHTALQDDARIELDVLMESVGGQSNPLLDQFFSWVEKLKDTKLPEAERIDFRRSVRDRLYYDPAHKEAMQVLEEILVNEYDPYFEEDAEMAAALRQSDKAQGISGAND
ncbi:hypothetical protein PQQ73_18055 [Paraburkholderia strydomiana]|uniref:Phospholipase D-like domain-containing protein n=1 Tax=Paraburkholderia strydomiana TaxID=1245417 RepID=A0ABW9EGS4_9BURK